VLAFALLRSSSSPPLRATGNSVAAIDPGSNRVVATVPVGAAAEGIAFTAGSLWVANVLDKTVSQVDPASGRLLRTLPISNELYGFAATPGAVWVAGEVPSKCPAGTCQLVTVSRIDPSSTWSRS
jgi:YVTN family beta-propeller protein